MRTSYNENDVIVLLKDITGLVEPEDTKTREQKIQSGSHYCEMLPKEYIPSDAYEKAYFEMLDVYAKPVAKAVATLAELIYAKDAEPVLISLARAGIPAGILVKRYLERKYGISVPHYAISIIRGRGIDTNAMQYILDRQDGSHFVFIDGWTGKGAIKHQLDVALQEYTCKKDLAVIADPAGVAEICGTFEDLMIPSACLNSTVSGLMSRTFLREDIIKPTDFHGAVYYAEMEEKDQSYAFIETIESYFDFEDMTNVPVMMRMLQNRNNSCKTGLDEARKLQKIFQVSDINFVKPGIGESTRVLLRRVPDTIVINERYKNAEELKPIYRLCKEKQVPIQYLDLNHYKVCGIIKQFADA